MIGLSQSNDVILIFFDTEVTTHFTTLRISMILNATRTYYLCSWYIYALGEYSNPLLLYGERKS